MKMLKWELLHPKMTMEHLGYIHIFFFEDDPRPAAQQIHSRYHFGGWQPFDGFTLAKDNSLTYPEDPPIEPLAQAKLRDEMILFYPHSWVAIVQPDRTFEVARID
jgi:hypothetical protein